MSLFSDRLLESHLARIIKEQSRDEAVDTAADWLDVMEEMNSMGVNTASIWSEVTVALIRLNLTMEVEERRHATSVCDEAAAT